MISDAELEAAINSELDNLADEAILRGDVANPGWEPEIDSHAVLSVCLRIQEETGVLISEECVPVGGFQDRETCIAVMMKHAKSSIAETAKQSLEEEET